MKLLPQKLLSNTVAMTLASILSAATVGAFAAGEATGQAVLVAQVRFDDLDLSSPAGVTTFRKRIYRAATQVCAPSELRQQEEHRRCVQDAADRALAQVRLTN